MCVCGGGGRGGGVPLAYYNIINPFNSPVHYLQTKDNGVRVNFKRVWVVGCSMIDLSEHDVIIFLHYCA